MTATQNVSLFVEAKPKQDRLLQQTRHRSIDPTTIDIHNGHLRFHNREGTDFRLEIKHRYPDLEALIENNTIQHMTLNPHGTRMWLAGFRLFLRNASDADFLPPEGVMGVDVGTINHLCLFWKRGGIERVEHLKFGGALGRRMFPQVARSIYEHLVRHNLHTLRLENLPKYGAPNQTCAELIVFIEQYVLMTGAGRIRVELVNPMFSSQSCPRCRQTNPNTPNVDFHCRYCTWDGNKDEVAARNIQRGGCIPALSTDLETAQ